ncbi:MAG TPA: glucose-6-phosphate dehydrogenase, partial [Candidatus Binataceae bacterium]
MDQTLTIQRIRPTPPCTIVIFGASGDLARRKLIPALYNLVHCGGGMMPESTHVLGFARSRISTEEFRKIAREGTDRYSRIEVDEDCWKKFASKLEYMSGLDQPDGYKNLKERLEQIETAQGIPPNRIYYLSIPPDAIRDCVSSLAENSLIASPTAPYFTRVVVEKPIGHDLGSALEINRTLRQHLAESQIFRIDHYLGKETVQNLLVLRFANTIFERLWGSRNVDNVQITVAESEGVGARAGYYDHSGALRDMVQNHILQTLALLTMEPPVTLDAAAIREAKLNVLRALRAIRPDQARTTTVRARYTAGQVDGERVPGYLEEKEVAPDSTTETYVALKVFIDNWRWSGVPIYLRTGKCLPRRASSIVVQFKDVPQILFNRDGVIPENRLTIRIQPDEGFSFDVIAKQPGL